MATPVEQYRGQHLKVKEAPALLLPEEESFTPEQWRTLMAISDTVIPTIIDHKYVASSSIQEMTVQSGEYLAAQKELEGYLLETQSKSIAKEYLEERPSQNPAFKACLHRFMVLYMPKGELEKFKMALNMLDTRLGALFFTGYVTPLADQPASTRHAILKAWSTSYTPVFRLLFKQMTTLIKQNWLRSTPNLNQLLQFPRVPLHSKSGKGYPFEFIQIPPGEDAEVIETDVVIVGSGCGAGVVAKRLAEAGQRVIVVEKERWWPAEHLPMVEDDAWNHMFMNGGAIMSDGGEVCVLAGSTWGGGGTVNWSASLQTQGFVRREWSYNDSLPFFTSAEFQDCLDNVCNRMGVSTTSITHNKSNDVLLEGARRLGWTAKPVPQNTGGSQHYCGLCSLGCGSCEKQGPTVSWLPDAAKAGATFIEGFDAREITFSTDANGKKIATGVQGLYVSRDEHGGIAGKPLHKRKLVIKAKRTIVSAGTMQSPLLLQRSGLKNKWIGKNLRVHPVSIVGAIYDEEIRPWEGGILTAVVSEFENQDSRGHGAKIESTVMFPTGFLSFMPWSSGLEFKMMVPRLKNMVGHISLARDSASGYVYPDPVDGRPRMVYSPTKADRKHILEGVVGAAKLNYVMGAREIFSSLPGTPIYKRPFASEDPVTSSDTPEDTESGINSPSFNAWLDLVRKRGLPDPDTGFFSAHQMGTCKMGATPQTGVVDPKGRVWEVDEGLYVADASVFPSASGVNPMITNMAIADWIARGIVKEVKGPEVRSTL